jgi:hypothetical protein
MKLWPTVEKWIGASNPRDQAAVSLFILNAIGVSAHAVGEAVKHLTDVSANALSPLAVSDAANH